MTWEELNAVRELNKMIQETEKVLNSLRQALALKVPNRDGMPKAKPLDSQIERITVRMVDTENELADLTVKFCEAAAELETKINQAVSDKMARTLLIMRYVDCMHFRDIGFAMGYSEAHTYWLHRQICDKLIDVNKPS